MNPKLKTVKPGLHVMVEDANLSRWVERDGRLDHARDFLAKFRHLIPPEGTVIDVGAMIGDHTMTYAEYVGINGTVWAFEANPDVAECCRLNMEKYPQVHVFPFGLSDRREDVGLLYGENVGAGFVSGTGNIPLQTLDGMAMGLKKLDFIKVDIEGYEPKFLDGAHQTIKRLRPAILMEVNEGALGRQGFTPDDILGRLNSWGYSTLPADGDFGMAQYDIIAIPDKS